MILQPVAPLMKNKRLVIVADRALHYVPFAALPEPVAANGHANGERPSSESATELSGQPLTVNHEIVSLPSASVLALLRQQYKDRKPAPKAVAVLADPVFNRHDPRVAPESVRTSDDAGQPKIGVQSSLARQIDISRSATPRLSSTHRKDELDDVLQASSFSEDLLTRSAGDLGLSRNGQLALPRLRYTREEADAIYAVTPRSRALEATDFRANRVTMSEAVSHDSLPNIVQFDHVTKKFGNLTVIRDVTFSVKDLPNKGEFISILGPSGAASRRCSG